MVCSSGCAVCEDLWMYRTNLAFAALTLNDDIGLTSTQYGLGSGLFFFLGYIIFQARYSPLWPSFPYIAGCTVLLCFMNVCFLSDMLQMLATPVWLSRLQCRVKCHPPRCMTAVGTQQPDSDTSRSKEMALFPCHCLGHHSYLICHFEGAVMPPPAFQCCDILHCSDRPSHAYKLVLTQITGPDA